MCKNIPPSPHSTDTGYHRRLFSSCRLLLILFSLRKQLFLLPEISELNIRVIPRVLQLREGLAEPLSLPPPPPKPVCQKARKQLILTPLAKHHVGGGGLNAKH